MFYRFNNLLHSVLFNAREVHQQIKGVISTIPALCKARYDPQQIEEIIRFRNSRFA